MATNSIPLNNIDLNNEVYEMLFNIRIYNVGKVEELTKKISESFTIIPVLNLFFKPENVFDIKEDTIKQVSKLYATSLGLNDKIQDIENILESISLVEEKSNEYRDITIISRTHGQPASPTKLGKELRVFWTRINVQIESLHTIPNSAKFSGAVGNFNAHKVAYPNINWKNFGQKLTKIFFGD